MSFRRTAISFALPLAIALPSLAAAQGEPSAPPAPSAAPSAAPRGWTVVRDPFAELWFHTMALVGDQGFGLLPLYDAARARATPRRTRRDAAANERLASIRRQLAADSTLEVLHFVPMYFVGAAPTQALDALDDAAALRSAGAGDRAHEVARAIVASLSTSGQRRALALAVAAARDEYAERTAAADTAARRPADLELQWNEEFLHAIGAYLARSGQLRGVIVVVPSVGVDGRVVASPALGTVVAVGVGTAADPDAPLLAAVRELTYRALDRVPVPHEGRTAAARRRDALAVRAGAILLESNTRLHEQYRAWYRAVSPFPFLAFEQLYPLDSATERALRAALAAPGLAQR